jgi:hypothetical protein
MTVNEFWDEYSYINCEQCRWCHTKCKRIDHKHFSFARPWFKSETYSQGIAAVCRDFVPASYCVWINKNWIGWDEWVKGFEKQPKTVSLCIDGDQSIRYHVSWTDFVNNTFVDNDGNLKWVYKLYYRKTRKSPIGYKLVTEYNPNYQ